jgi:hypothetical protein
VALIVDIATASQPSGNRCFEDTDSRYRKSYLRYRYFDTGTSGLGVVNPLYTITEVGNDETSKTKRQSGSPAFR